MTSYWLATLVWDLLNAMVPVAISFVLFAAFQVDGYTGEALGGILLLLVCIYACMHVIVCVCVCACVRVS